MAQEHERLRRIRLVSEHFHELQGLRAALIGSAFTVSMACYLVVTGWNDGVIHPAFAIGLAFAIMVPGMQWLDRYYETTLGRVKPRLETRGFGRFIIPVGIGAATVIDNWLFETSGGGLVLGLGAFWLWIAIRDWPLRGYHLVGAIAGFLAEGVQLTDAARQAPDAALAAGLLVVGIAAMLTGFADHRLLTGSFTLAHPDQAPEKLLADERR